MGLEVGYRFGSRLSLSGYVEYGFGAVPNALCGGVDCSAHRLRWGALLECRFVGEPTDSNSFHVRVVPWAGLGIGYETLSVGIARGAQQAVRTDRGPVVDALLGLDVVIAPRVAVGALLALAAGQFLSAHVETPGGAGSFEITHRRWHAWPMAGLRVSYDF